METAHESRSPSLHGWEFMGKRRLVSSLEFRRVCVVDAKQFYYSNL